MKTSLLGIALFLTFTAFAQVNDGGVTYSNPTAQGSYVHCPKFIFIWQDQGVADIFCKLAGHEYASAYSCNTDGDYGVELYLDGRGAPSIGNQSSSFGNYDWITCK